MIEDCSLLRQATKLAGTALVTELHVCKSVTVNYGCTAAGAGDVSRLGVRRRPATLLARGTQLLRGNLGDGQGRTAVIAPRGLTDNPAPALPSLGIGLPAALPAVRAALPGRQRAEVHHCSAVLAERVRQGAEGSLHVSTSMIHGLWQLPPQ